MCRGFQRRERSRATPYSSGFFDGIVSEHYVRVTWKDTADGPELVETIILPTLKTSLDALKAMEQDPKWRPRLEDRLVVRIELLPLARMA